MIEAANGGGLMRLCAFAALHRADLFAAARRSAHHLSYVGVMCVMPGFLDAAQGLRLLIVITRQSR